MRPLGLELEGFAAFRERTTVDFRDADLFAIVGATGHGKSSLIDAISFALYGKVPRHGEHDIAPVMTLGCNETRVSFTFELAGASYIATRVLRRKAVRRRGDHTCDAPRAGARRRHDRCPRREEGRVRRDRPQARRPRLRAVHEVRGAPPGPVRLVPARPGRRPRRDPRARSSTSAATTAWPPPRANGPSVPPARAKRSSPSGAPRRRPRPRRSHRRARVTTRSHGLRTDLDAAAPRDLALAAEIVRRAAGADSARRAGPRPGGGATFPTSSARSCSRSTTARAGGGAAPRSRPTPPRRARSPPRRHATQQPPLDDLRAAADAHTERATAGGTHPEGRGGHCRAAAPPRTRPRTRSSTATPAVEQAQAALEDAQHRHAHAELRASLHVGEPCPVCDQDVAKLPPKLRATEVEKARKAAGRGRRRSRTRAERAAQEAHHRAREERRTARRAPKAGIADVRRRASPRIPTRPRSRR